MKAIVLFAAAVAGITVFAQSPKPAAAEKNMVFDGGFDTIKRNGTTRFFGTTKKGVYYGWSLAQNTKEGINKADLDKKIFVSAPNSMRLEILKDKNPLTLNQSLHYYKKRLQPGKKYRISCMIKLEKVTPNGAVLNLAYGKNNLWSKWLTGTSDWQKLAFEITAAKNADQIKNLDLNIRFYGTGTIWVDNVCVEQL